MFEDILSNPVIYAGIIGAVRGFFGYVNGYMSSKGTSFDGKKFLKGLLRAGVFAATIGFATGSPEAAWAAVPVDMVVSETKK